MRNVHGTTFLLALLVVVWAFSPAIALVSLRGDTVGTFATITTMVVLAPALAVFFAWAPQPQPVTRS